MKWVLLQNIADIVVLACLFIMSIEDIRMHEIKSMWLIILGVWGFILMLFTGNGNIPEIVNRFWPGAICFLGAWITREQMGYGDALLILILGFYMDSIAMINICLMAFTLAGMISAFLMIGKRHFQKLELPLIPFLSFGYVWVNWLSH